MAKGTVDKWKSKKWIDVLAPKMFNSKPVGSTVATDIKKVLGRVVNVNLGDLTGDRSMRQRVKLRFKIEKIIGDQAITKFLGYAVQQDNRRNIGRKKSIKVYVNKKVTTKDGKEFIVKSSIVMDRGASRSTKTEVLKKYEEFLTNEASGEKFTNLISDLLGNNVALKAKKELHKIYPVKHITIEKTEISEKLELPDEPVAKMRQRRMFGDRNTGESEGRERPAEKKEKKQEAEQKEGIVEKIGEVVEGGIEKVEEALHIKKKDEKEKKEKPKKEKKENAEPEQ
ncbi:MAG: hypothetical protein ABIF92_01490 [archaeon]